MSDFKNCSRDTIIETLQKAYYLLMGKNLPIYGVQTKEQMKEFYTSMNDIKKGIEKLPPEAYRYPEDY